MNYLKIFLVVLFCVLIPILCKIKSKSSYPQERLELEKIYLMTNGVNWVHNDNWLSDSISICNWYGIRCDEKKHVIEIHLNNNGLKGKIPDDLGNLRELKVLYLSNNELQGGIRQAITQCSKLETVWINSNKLGNKTAETNAKCTYLKWLEFAC